MFDFLTPAYLAGLSTGTAIGTIAAGLVIYKRATSPADGEARQTAHTWRGYLLFTLIAFLAGITFTTTFSGEPRYELWLLLVGATSGFIGGWVFNGVIGVPRDSTLMHRQRNRHLREMAELRRTISALHTENARLRHLLGDSAGGQPHE
ncbi:hypothetical protein OHR68_14065 [Spirillospora sp. NBC_00431]